MCWPIPSLIYSADYLRLRDRQTNRQTGRECVYRCVCVCVRNYTCVVPNPTTCVWPQEMWETLSYGAGKQFSLLSCAGGGGGGMLSLTGDLTQHDYDMILDSTTSGRVASTSSSSGSVDAVQDQSDDGLSQTTQKHTHAHPHQHPRSLSQTHGLPH